jgi:Zn-dependent M28 family amino/carboxypeptidase
VLSLAFWLLARPLPAADFDSPRAFADLTALVRLGPRLPGSAAAGGARGLIAERLKQAGWQSESRAVAGSSPALVNLTARKARPGAKKIFLVTHYDTKSLAAGGSPGANDGASGVAALLEVARQFPDGLKHAELWLLFCDGSEPLGSEMNLMEGQVGSRALVVELEKDGQLTPGASAIYVDMIADRDLHLTPGQPRSPELAQRLANVVHKLGAPDVLDLDKSYFVPGDYRPFMERGVNSVLSFVDFEYGARTSPGPLWHGAQDDLRNVSETSLQQSGRILVALLVEVGD